MSSDTSKLYTDEDLLNAQMVQGEWANNHRDPRTSTEAILDAVAPAIAARALREAAGDLRRHWSNDAVFASMDDPETWYSADRWIEVYAERIEAGR